MVSLLLVESLVELLLLLFVLAGTTLEQMLQPATNVENEADGEFMLVVIVLVDFVVLVVFVGRGVSGVFWVARRTWCLVNDLDARGTDC